ncbi:Imm26 family immunity protein [uncultured Friedmanniella sp.]|uniref:Imm26 family immunity protein n=1 Tax=uncultured Friedmanniella sp. TaxID=335381 RepID=UPI0035C96AA0
MAREPRIKVGDVFILPTNDGRNVVGQVVALGEQPQLYYLAVFDEVISHDTPVERFLEATSSPVLFFGLSMNAKFKAGHWTMIGNKPVASNIKLPAYKETVGFPPKWEVVDYTGAKRRRATELEAELLPYRKIVSPMYFEVALRAHLGLEPWNDVFNTILPQGGVSSSDLFEH